MIEHKISSAEPIPKVTDSDCGIIEFISNSEKTLKGATIKHRFSDFIVN